ncbi:MAG: xanthine dehydrogenase family protein molybdopterin-binding subunit [Gammaproteobacteria bacterium]|nr:MAG: xanthine dehydrogenase family protein molybdopterin-binding subunit [Gammaproteobacteria bacterium]
MSEALDTREYKVIGSRVVRPDGIDKVTGRAAFGADLNLPGMLLGVVLRSPHAHARIKSIDTSKAQAMDGVYAVITGADFPNASETEDPALSANVMAREKVLYHGHAVAAVAATSMAIANAAAAAIEVDYEPLKPVLSLDEAMADGATIIDEQLRTAGADEASDTPTNVAQFMRLDRGDVEQGFAEADVIVEGEFATPTVHQGYIEPHACVATINEGGQANVWCSTQGHFDVRSLAAKVLKINVADLRVTASEIGGGFGGKTTIYLEPVAIVMSGKARRPVKMTMTREEVFRASGPASATKSRIKIGAKSDGTLTAMQAWIGYEAGAFPGGPLAPGLMCVFAPYNAPNFLIEGVDVLVNKPKVAAYRAPGAPQAMYAGECMMDELARKLKIDPIDLRILNAVEEGSTATYGPKFKAIGFKACLEAAKAHPNYTRQLAEGEGRGIAAGFWFNAGMQSSAEVHVNENGTVTVIEGNPDIGGSRASMALMAAEELGIPYEQIRVIVADTESAGYTNVTGGSRVTFATGMAVIQASRDIITQLKERAAATWGIEEELVEWEDGHAVPKPGVNADVQPLSLADIAGNAGRTGGPILGRASLNARGAGPGFSVNLADVKIDRETGKVDVTRFTAIQDAGKAIHPSYVEGQMQGGAAQGIGWALNEEYIYDADGVMENAGFLDYRVPVASDLPMIDTQIIEIPNPTHPYGVRGVGETPIVAPLAAVANAVRDATGIRISELPLSPPRVLEALDAAEE